jgi:hypothetical protein
MIIILYTYFNFYLIEVDIQIILCVYISYDIFNNKFSIGCNFRRRIRENIAAHIRQQHNSDPDFTIQKVTTKPKEPRPLLKCEECEANLSTMTQLLQHKIKMHNYHITESEAEDLKCGECQIVCATKSGLRAHERSHQVANFCMVLSLKIKSLGNALFSSKFV